jgi:hypothetical protein
VALGGGAWSSSAATAVIGASSGIVSGISAGTANITYTSASGCKAFTSVAVNQTPAAITGTATVCAGETTTLNNTATGGTWSCAGGIMTINNGIVTGVTAGTEVVTYTLGAGCSAVKTVTVNALPAAITGATNVCAGSTIDLDNVTPAGVWTSGSTAVATTAAATGIVNGLTAGTTTIFYTLNTGCKATAVITVDPLPAAITGTAKVCPGATTMLATITAGGSWSTGSALISIDNSGTVTGIASGTAVVTYASVAGCNTLRTVIVSTVPAAITGRMNMCEGATTILTNSTTGGAWSGPATGIVNVNATSGAVAGLATGIAAVTYTNAAGCSVSAHVTVDPLPAAITGPAQVCANATMTLNDVTTGGTWSSANTAFATISATSGIVTGRATGIANIVYTAGGCSVGTTVSVLTAPGAITGVRDICAASAGITVNNAVAGGLWDASGVTISSAGNVTGTTASAGIVSYTLPNGCFVTAPLTVHPLPLAITGITRACSGLTTTLNDGIPGGAWSSSNTAIAKVTALTGIVTGMVPGATVITYTLPTGCYQTEAITVSAVPSAISGTATLCAGGSAILTNAVAGGLWSSSDAALGITTGGTITGRNAGAAIITYTMGANCVATKAVTILPEPGAYVITGGGNYCAGGAGVHIGISGSSTGASYVLSSGTATTTIAGNDAAIDFGLQTTTGTYTVAAINAAPGCFSNVSGSAVVTVAPVVTASVGVVTSPGKTVCAGTQATFTTTTVNGGTAPEYQWLVNGVNAYADAATYTYIPGNGDVVTAVMTSNAVCAIPPTVTAAETMTVEAAAVPDVRIMADPGNTILPGQA